MNTTRHAPNSVTRHRRLAGAIVIAAILTFASADAQTTAPDKAKSLTLLASGIPCSDLERSIAFYTNGLGLALGNRMETGGVVEASLTFPGGGAYLLLVKAKEGATIPTAGEGQRKTVLGVPDLKALNIQLETAGYHLDGAIRANPEHHVAVAMVKDPDGNVLELVQRGE